jgi:hypothetical protein
MSRPGSPAGRDRVALTLAIALGVAANLIVVGAILLALAAPGTPGVAKAVALTIGALAAMLAGYLGFRAGASSWGKRDDGQRDRRSGDE